MTMPLMKQVVPSIPLILNKPSADYFNETRAKVFGAPLYEVAKTATEEDWEAAKAPAKEAGDLLRRNGGPYFLGGTGKSLEGRKFELELTINSVLWRFSTCFAPVHDEVP
jgi:hypothetical protein